MSARAASNVWITVTWASRAPVSSSRKTHSSTVCASSMEPGLERPVAVPPRRDELLHRELETGVAAPGALRNADRHPVHPLDAARDAVATIAKYHRPESPYR